MSKIIITLMVLALSSMASAMIISEESLSTLWGAWKTAHNKQYSSSEESHRFIVFQNNVAKIAKLNAEDSGAKFAINKFADLTSAEFKQKYTGGVLIESRVSGNQEFQTESITEPLSATVDWRGKGAVTDVQDQGSCGSCWAFSAIAAIEGLYKIKNGELLRFSEQQLMDCSGSYGNQGCRGGWMVPAFQYAAKSGTMKASDYPYNFKVGMCRARSSSALKVVSGYQDVTSNSYTSLKKAVSSQPVSVALQADQDAFQFYKSGVLSSGCGTKLNHAGLAVGYQGSEYWIVKNSWGKSWGMSGYINIKMGSEQNGAGVCGINSAASYPTS